MILTTPAVRAARREFPDARLAFLTYARFRPVYEHNPRLDEIITADRRSLAFVRKLRERRFNASVDLHGKPRTALIALAARIGRRIGGTALDTVRVPIREGDHASQHALDALAPLGVENVDLRPEVFVGPIEERAAQARLEQFGLVPGERPLLGVFPGAGWGPKAWMPERFAEIANRAMDEWNAQVVVVGTSKEKERVDRIVALTRRRVAPLLNLPLGVLAGVIRQCDRFLSSDSGPMHLATAVGTPTVALFGPGDFARFAPRATPHVALREPIACSPCKQFRDHCRNNACLQLLSVDRVWNAMEPP